MAVRRKKIFRIILMVLLALLLAAGVFTQTAMFRTTLRSTLYTVLERELNAEFYLGRIDGSILTGFTVDTVMMYVDGAPFVESGRLSVKYDLLALLGNHLDLDTVTIENPSVRLIRWKNGEWNTDHLPKRRAPKDSAASTFRITAGKIRIVNGTFRLIDSTGLNDSVFVDRNGRRSVNYSDLDLRSIALEAKGSVSSSVIDVTVAHAAWGMPKEAFVLDHLAGAFTHTKERTTLTGLVLRTPVSAIDGSAALEHVDAFAVRTMHDLRNGECTLTIAPSTIHTNDLHTFIPSLQFLEGEIHAAGSFSGNFENLVIHQANVSAGNSTVSLSGSITDLYKADQMRLNVITTGSTIDPADLPPLLPLYKIPDYAHLGPVTVDLQFVGKPTDFLAVSTVRSAAGTVTVDGQMVITEDNIKYKGILAGSGVNLERVFATNEVLSRINTKVYVEGQGTSLATLDAEATVQVDSSSFREIPVQTATLTVKAKDRKFSGTLSLRSPDGAVTASTSLDLTDSVKPAYALTASVRNLNLAPVYADPYYASNLSFDLQRSGVGLTLFDNPSDTRVSMLPSSFRGESIDSAQAVLQWMKDSSGGDRLHLRSPIADGDLEGRFTFGGMIQGIRSHIAALDKAYRYQRSIVDTSTHVPPDSTAPVPDTTTNIAYSIVLKKLTPLSTFFRFPALDLVGTVKGQMGTEPKFASSSGTVHLEHGSYADTNARLQARQLSLTYLLDHLSVPDLITTGDPLRAVIDFSGEEMKVNETVFRSMSLGLDFERRHGTLKIAADIDSTISVAAEGTIDVADRTNRFTLSSFKGMYQGLSLSNATPMVITESMNGITIDTCRLVRRDEEVVMSGRYDYRGLIGINALIRNFAMSDLFFVNRSPAFREQAYHLTGSVDASVTVTGTAANPVIDAQMEGKGIGYKTTSFGDLNAALSYARKKAGIRVTLDDAGGTDTLRSFELEGVVPIDLAFLPLEDRTSLLGMDLQLDARGLPMEMFDIFVPEIDRMKGEGDASIEITGSLAHPSMKGGVTLRDGTFRLEMTGVEYRVAGTIALDTQTMTFPSLTIRNTAADYPSGAMTIGGSIAMDGFAPSIYHVTMDGELLTMSERAEGTIKAFTGRLITKTGKNGLRFEGTFEQSRVIGDVLVQEAAMVFPPTAQSASSATARFDDVQFVDDTTRTEVDSAIVRRVLSLLSSSGTAPGGERTFMDGFGYELTIETKGTVTVKMIFSADVTAYEELFAVLNGKMVLKKDDAGQHLTGTIRVADGSKYQFYKEFKATGSLTFVGDPQNPQLNILAKYDGLHCKKLESGNAATSSNCLEYETVVVSLEITGNRIKPNLKIGLATLDPNGREIPRQGDVENDATAFLLTSSSNTPGQFRDELSAVDKNRISNQLTEAIGGTFINNLLGSVMNDFIKENKIPFVKRVEVRNVTSEADIKIQADFFGAVVSFGGKVFSDMNNANVSVQWPVLGEQNRNFILEVERKTENYDYLQTRAIIGARLFYRFLF